MSEATIDAQPTETDGAEQETPKPKPTETVEFWKQKAREQEQRAKANADAANRLKEFEDRDKTEAQKLAERAEAAERRVAEIEAHAIRLEVAAEKGLTPAQAKRLVGSTRAELEADADELLETFKPAAPAEEPVGLPSLDLGTRGSAPLPLNGDPLEQALRKSLGI
jgi:hypothetical protein